jgi:23S rRNA (cytosine1962-C5)-methyltransferase
MAEQDAPRSRLAVRITRDALRHVKAGHPWIYDDAITKITGAGGSAGDLAVVFDDYRRFVAVGLYDPWSPIRIKVLAAGQQVTVDRSFWAARVHSAAELRRPLAATDTTGYRLVNGENDGFPGLVVDRYSDTLVCKVYSDAWFVHLNDLAEVLVEETKASTVIVRLARSVAERAPYVDGDALVGTSPTAPVMFRENGLCFEANVVQGQKTGHFLDQRDNRARVRTMTRGRRVLDVFASTGGFTVYAAAGGASAIDSVDLSGPTLAVAKRNLEHNAAATSTAQQRSISGDAFAVMAQLASAGERYDVVVIDPPSFAQRQSDIDDALRAYYRLAQLGAQLTSKGGWLVQCSCSSRVEAEWFYDAVYDGVESTGATLVDAEFTGHAIDHPVTFREGAYLKAVFARVTA